MSRAKKLHESLTGEKEVELSESMKENLGKMNTNELAAVAGQMKKRVSEIMDQEGEAPFAADEEAQDLLKTTGVKLKDIKVGLKSVSEADKPFKKK